MKILNYNGGSDSSGKIQGSNFDKTRTSTDWKKEKKIYRGESSNQRSPQNSKRKVSFTSPKKKIYFFDPRSAPLRPIRIRGPDETNKKESPKSLANLKKKDKQIYRVKTPQITMGLEKTNLEEEKEKQSQTKHEVFYMEGINLTVDLGHLSPITDVAISSPKSLSTTNHLSATQAEAVNDSIGSMMVSDKEDADLNDTEQQNEDEAFKKKLLALLKNKNLKLITSSADDFEKVVNETNEEENAMIMYEKGQASSP